MYRLYKKNELNFSLVWIISYVVLFSVADSFSASLGTEKIIAAPVAIVFTLLLLEGGAMPTHGAAGGCTTES